MSSTMITDSKKKALIDQLIASGCLKFGQFTLKSGETSDYYIDLREATIHPILFGQVVESIKNIIPKESCSSDFSKVHENPKKTAIVGIPYGVVPVAAAVAYECKIIYFPLRKEVKDYGVQPKYAEMCPDHEFILIEDVMSTGSSIIESMKKLDGKKITDVIVIVNRESGGEENLSSLYPNVRLHSILKASEIMHYRSNGKTN